MLDLWPYNSGLKERVSAIEKELAASEMKVLIRAAIGAGRHSIVKALASRLDLVVVELPSFDDLDAALHGLVQLSTQAGTLEHAGTFEARTRVAGQALADANRALVMLLPVPHLEPSRESEATTRRQIEHMVATLADVAPLRMAAIATHEVRLDAARFDTAFELTAPKIGAHQILPDKVSGTFSAAASALARWMTNTGWASSPLEARLQVGSIALGERPENLGVGLVALASKLTEQLARWPTLALAVHRLLLARRPLPKHEVARLSGVDEAWLPLLTSCIGYGDETVRVPEVTRHVLLEALEVGAAQLEEAHEALADYHERLDGAGSLHGLAHERAINWMEKVHHLALGGPKCAARWAEQEPAGPEQLWERARHLSRDLHRFSDAAAIYRQCLGTFGDDPYSRHYLAYNLERSTRDVTEVRTGYAYAVSVDPGNPWWQQRWIRFLIAHGTLAEARSAWSAAIKAIDPDGTQMRSSSWLALNLHCWVARRWLATGHIRDARAVLSDVPARWLRQEKELRELQQVLTSYEQSLELGESVYPARTPLGDRWERPSVLKPSRAGHKLVEWAPGRVIEATATDVTVVVARTPREAEQQTFDATQWLSIAGEPAGDASGFFELGRYADGSLVVRSVPDDGEGAALDAEDRYLVERVTTWSP